MRIGWGLKVKQSACHGIEPELPQDGVETVQVRKVLALDALALYRYCSGLEKRRRRRSTPVTCCQITLNICNFIAVTTAGIRHLTASMPICIEQLILDAPFTCFF